MRPLSKKIPALLLLALFAGCHVTRETVVSNITPDVSDPVRISAPEQDAAEPAIASRGDDVYVAWIDHQEKLKSDLLVARFNIDGQPQGAPVRVNSEPGTATAWRGDPPTIAIAPDNTLYVGWTMRVEAESGHATTLYLSASHDQGKTFLPAVKVNDDAKPAVHGMHSLAVGPDGRVYFAWLDERNVHPMPPKDQKMDAKSSGRHMESNREVFFTVSSDGGKTFAPNQVVAKEACPCCKTALAVSPDGHTYLSWRQVLAGDFRHIAVAALSDDGKSFAAPVIVSDDQWILKGCPVSGASIMADAGRLRVVWYAGKEDGQQGLYYSESTDGGKSFRARSMVSAGFAHGTPVLLSDGHEREWTIWEASANGASEIRSSSLGKNDTMSVSAGELPAATALKDRLLVAYISKEGERRGIWLRIQRSALSASPR